MTKREVVRTVLEGRPPPYVPWSIWLTQEARENLARATGASDIEPLLENHILSLDPRHPVPAPPQPDWFVDAFGVTWDCSRDKDIGVIRGHVLAEPTLAGYEFPDPVDPAAFAHIPAALQASPGLFRVFSIGFSLYERAWTLRGMENLMMDFHDHPEFVHALLTAITDWNIACLRKALTFNFDAVYFGDDWGQQRGLQMGPELWREFIRPQLVRAYAEVKKAGKFVFIHSCGDVDELFDDLVGIGLDCFNPFQPEVMDVYELLARYQGRLSFHGGLSTQRTLPYGSADDVRRETRRLLEAGASGNYIFAPAHAVEGDVPAANILAFLDEVKSQRGYCPQGA